MDLLDRLLQHDAWTTRQLLELCGPLTDDQLDRDFDLGHRTIRRTFEHVIFNMEVWTDLMEAVSQRGEKGSSIRELVHRLDRVEKDFARVARAVADRGAWDEPFLDVIENPPVRQTLGGGIAHVITHSMHHRAQILYMLRCIGVQNRPEGDVLSWERQAAKFED